MAILSDIYANVQIAPGGVETFVRLSQGENGRRLTFYVTGNALPSGSSVIITGTKPDGVVYSKVGELTENTAVFTEDVQLTAVAGNWRARLEVTNGGQTIATGIIRFVIEAGPVDAGAIPSESELDGLVAEARHYAEVAQDSSEHAAERIEASWFANGAKNVDVDTLNTSSKKMAGAVNELKADLTAETQARTAADTSIQTAIGSTPISGIGDGTVSGAISALNASATWKAGQSVTLSAIKCIGRTTTAGNRAYLSLRVGKPISASAAALTVTQASVFTISGPQSVNNFSDVQDLVVHKDVGEILCTLPIQTAVAGGTPCIVEMNVTVAFS